MTRIAVFCSALLLLASGVSRAQESVPSPMTIGLFDIPRMVLSNSLAEKQRQIDLRISRMDVKNHPFEYFPSLNLDYSPGIDGLFKSGDFHANHSFSLSSSWEILQSGDRWIKQQIQRVAYQDLLLANTDNSQQEIYDCLNLYLDCLNKKLKYESSLSNESLARVQYEYVLARKSQGRASDLDILNAQSEADSTSYDTASGRMEYDLSLLRLSRKLRVESVGLPPDPLAEIVPPQAVNMSREEIPQAITNLVEFKRMELGRKDLKLKQALAFRQRFIPSVRVSVDMDWYRNSKTGQSGYVTREGSFDGNLNVGIGVPLFEKNVYLNAWRKSSLAIEKHALNLQQTMEAKEAELLEAVQNHDNELILLPVAERRLESSRINYERMAESFKLGVGSLLDLYQASQNYRKGQEALTSLRVNLVLLRAKIGYLMGDTMKYLR